MVRGGIFYRWGIQRLASENPDKNKEDVKSL